MARRQLTLPPLPRLISTAAGRKYGCIINGKTRSAPNGINTESVVAHSHASFQGRKTALFWFFSYLQVNIVGFPSESTNDYALRYSYNSNILTIL